MCGPVANAWAGGGARGNMGEHIGSMAAVGAHAHAQRASVAKILTVPLYWTTVWPSAVTKQRGGSFGWNLYAATDSTDSFATTSPTRASTRADTVGTILGAHEPTLAE